MFDVTNFLSFQIHGSAGGHKAGDGIAGGLVELLTFLESLVGLSPSEMFAAFFPGIAAMANLHPLVVHFPIAFLMAFLLIDLTGALFRLDSWRRLASGLLYLGTIGAAAAIGVGLLAEQTLQHGENVHLILERHKFFGITVFCLAAFLSVWRILAGGVITGMANPLFFLFAIVMNLMLLLGADLGGLMVYKHGVAVQAVEEKMMDYFQEHTHSH